MPYKHTLMKKFHSQLEVAFFKNTIIYFQTQIMNEPRQQALVYVFECQRSHGINLNGTFSWQNIEADVKFMFPS